MAARKITSKRGLEIEIWDTGFRVEGMSKVVSVGRNFTDDQLVQLTDAIYDKCLCNATHKAKNIIKDVLGRKLDNILKEV